MFDTTLWSRIEEAQRGEPSAVELLVARYRPALVAYFKGKGVGAADAEDLAQEVLLRLFAQAILARADKERGRFRAYLLGVARNVLREDRGHRGAKKRGGGAAHVPLDEATDVPAAVPDEGFDTIWAEQLLARALEELKRDNPRQHETLLLRFQGDTTPTAIAAKMGRTPQQVNNDLHRARKRISQLVKADIARYASSREEYEDDLSLFTNLVGA